MEDGASRRPTIRDVAAAAGVSKSLVSLLYAGGSVGPERRERILAVADRLGFRPNLTARALSSADGGFTGVLVADLHNSVFAEVVDAARAELARHGRSALLTSAIMPDPDGVPRLDERALAVFHDLRPRSILVVGSIPDLAALTEIIAGTPLVVASAVGEHVPVAATVRSDDGAGIRLAVEHLLKQGHRRIAHIGGRGGVVAERRLETYLAAVVEHGLEPLVAPADFTERAGYTATRELLETDGRARPTGIVAANDLAAVGALAAASAAGAAMAVTGYDDSQVARLPQVGLTSVDPRNAEIGAAAAGCVIEVESGAAPKQPETLIAPRLVVRASTPPPH